MANSAGSIMLFAGFSTEEANVALTYFKLLKIADGATIFKQGDPGHSLYIVDEGKVSVLSGEKEIATMPKGRPFGEMSLLDGRPRSATCKGFGGCSVLVLDDKSLRVMMRNSPVVATKLLYALASSLTSRLRRADNKLMEVLWSDA